MISSSLLSAYLHPPMRVLKLGSSHRLPTSKNPILTRGAPPKRPLVGRLRVSEPRSMTELVSADAFGDENGVGNGGNGWSDFGRGLSWGEVESAINEVSKWLVASFIVLVILWKHDAEALWVAMGSLFNSWLSVTLKQILNHQRPASATRSDPGMPSSHAQSIFYAASFASVLFVHSMGMNVLTLISVSVIFTCGSYLSWLRISQQLHTINQVLVGAALGSAFSITWYWMWHSIVLSAFIAFIWVRILVVLGSASLCAAFFIYVIRHWLMDDQ